jgi:hypothetical protein
LPRAVSVSSAACTRTWYHVNNALVEQHCKMQECSHACLAELAMVSTGRIRAAGTENCQRGDSPESVQHVAGSGILTRHTDMHVEGVVVIPNCSRSGPGTAEVNRKPQVSGPNAWLPASLVLWHCSLVVVQRGYYTSICNTKRCCSA